MKFTLLRFSTLAAALLAAGLTSTTRASHTLGYLFNDPAGSTTAVADGGSSSAGSPMLVLSRGAVIGADGSGVSGMPGDRSFNNSATTGTGATSGGGRGEHTSDFEPIDAPTSFTLAGWFKADGNTSSQNETIWSNSSSATNGYELSAFGGGILRLSTENSDVNSDPVFTEADEWINFAVTYDGTIGQPGPNVFFYKGTTTSPLVAAGSGTAIVGDIANDTSPLFVGGIPFAFGQMQTTFAFDGELDNLRYWDSVVPLAGLEDVRVADTGVPEPTTLVLAGIAGVTLLLRRRM